MNFAGGGHQTAASGFSIDSSNGHVTVRKDEAGIVTIAICTATELISGQCPTPSYTDCKSCQDGSNPFACWCNPPNNIYGSGGCQPDTDCMWTLVSDIWNGVSGDAGTHLP